MHESDMKLGPLNVQHTSFIHELLNTEAWKRFIGDRNVHNVEDARQYIHKILASPQVVYHVVHLKEVPIGIVTVIKRDYLDHHDLGFAFLPQFRGKGYAYEASQRVLEDLLGTQNHAKILATTVPENTKSIALLTKLGFSFVQQLPRENEVLDVYEYLTNTVG